MQRLLYWHHTVAKTFIGTLKTNKQKILQAYPKGTQPLFTHRPKWKKPPLLSVSSPSIYSFVPFSLLFFLLLPHFLYSLLICSAFMLSFSLLLNFLLNRYYLNPLFFFFFFLHFLDLLEPMFRRLNNYVILQYGPRSLYLGAKLFPLYLCFQNFFPKFR